MVFGHPIGMRAVPPGIAARASHRGGSHLRVFSDACRRVLAVLSLVACASFGAHAADGTSGNRTFGDSVGLGVKFIQGQSLDTLPMLKDLKVKWAREHVNWRDIETSPGTYGALPANLRRQLAYYRENDIGLVGILTLSRAGTTPTSPEEIAVGSNAEAFGRFAARAAQLLKAEGVRFVLEVGNEPHNSHLVKALGGQWNGRPPSPWLDHYVQMVNAAVRNVKADDPSVKVLAGDDMWVVDYWMLEAGLDPRLDGLTVHPYARGIPEIAAVANDTDWVRPFVAVDADRSLQSGVKRLRAAALQKFGRPVEIWITEMGWPVAEGERAVDNATPERTVASYIPRSFILAAEAGVEGFCWFSSQDAIDGPMGLTRNDWSQRLTYSAFRTMTEQLGDLKFVHRLQGEKGTDAAVQAFLFANRDRSVVVAWNARGTEDMQFVLPQYRPNDLAVIDLVGNRKLVPARNRRFSVPINGEPVYIQLFSRSEWASAFRIK